MFGLDGIFIEIFKDISFRLPLISKEGAYEMVENIRGHMVLQDARGKKQFDIEALIDILIKFSYLCLGTCEAIREIDINPLIVGETGNGVKVVDALMVLD